MLAVFFLVLGVILICFIPIAPVLVLPTILCAIVALMVSPDEWFHKRLYSEYKNKQLIKQEEIKRKEEEKRIREYRIKKAEKRRDILKKQQARLENLATDWLEAETNRITKKMYRELNIMIDLLAENGSEIKRIVSVIKEIAKDIPLVYQTKDIDFSKDTESDIDFRIENIQHMEEHFINFAQLTIYDTSNVYIRNTLTFLYSYNPANNSEAGFYFTVHEGHEQILSLYCGKLDDIIRDFISDLLKILVTNYSLHTFNFEKELAIADSMEIAIHAHVKEKLEAERIREHIPRAVRHEVWQRDKGRCVECGSKEKLEFDHIIPVSKGGANTVRNIQLLCEACNRSKSANI